jgi:hypothetical protein
MALIHWPGVQKWLCFSKRRYPSAGILTRNLLSMSDLKRFLKKLKMGSFGKK